MTGTAAVLLRPAEVMIARRNQESMNRRGCYFTGFAVLIVVVLLAAIGVGLLDELDLGKINWVPTM